MHASKYPILACMVRDVFPIIPSTVAAQDASGLLLVYPKTDPHYSLNYIWILGWLDPI